MSDKQLKGWDQITHTLITSKFNGRAFTLKDLYAFEPRFRLVYPDNAHIKDKIRQVLQHLRDKNLIVFLGNGMYELTPMHVTNTAEYPSNRELVYLLSNESIPGWVKIGRTKSIEDRLKSLYNTSVPLPFKVEDTITTDTTEQSRTVERSIHSIIDTLNPDLRKNTEASKREFFRMTPEEGKSIFSLVTTIMSVSPADNRISY
jgi:hypothetical protein